MNKNKDHEAERVNSSMMDFPIVPDTAAGYDLSGILVLAMPIDADRYLLLDAFMDFVEKEVERLGEASTLASERLSWVEVAPDEFGLSCAVRAGAMGQGMLLHAVVTEGRLAIIPDHLTLDPGDWDRLIDALFAADAAGASRPENWRVLYRPSVFNIPDKPQPPPLARADRRLPIRATMEQRACLALARAIPNGQHPAVGMRPIHIVNPDHEALRATFEALQERHEILHMTFVVSNGQDYLALTDKLAVPFEIVNSPQPMYDLDASGATHSATLAQEGFADGLLWRARLITHGDTGLLCCVFSESISDSRSADILRSEIIQFYKAFLSGGNPEARWPEPVLHYTDYAAAEEDRANHRDSWKDSLPLLEAGVQDKDTLYAAPVLRFAQYLKQDVQERLQICATRQGISLRTIVLSAFLGTLREVANPSLSWLLVSLHEQRPIGAQSMPGPFSFDCPMWLGSDRSHLDLDLLQASLSRVLAQGASTLEDIEALDPAQTRSKRIYRYDGDGSPRVIPSSFARATISLRLIRTKTELSLEWLIRQDDPLAQSPEILLTSLLKHIDAILETYCSLE